MVGLVLVSHSRALAQALAELVRQVSAAPLPLCAVGGAGPQKNEFGTDAVEIFEAIDSICSDDGVVVLADLGSAVLAAETAVELLDPQRQARVTICAGPLVEGALAAGVQIGLGSDRHTVCREAQKALAPKTQHLAPPGEPQADTAAPPSGPFAEQDWLEICLPVDAPHGLHVRPAARLVQTAAAFDAEVRVKKYGTAKAPVSASSLNRIATLAVRKGERILVSTRGPQAQAALQAIRELIQSFAQDGTEAAWSPPQDTTAGKDGPLRQAVALSEGIAVGPLFHYRPATPRVSRQPAQNPAREWKALQHALDMTAAAVRRQRRALAVRAGEAAAAIFDAHLLILQDPALIAPARRRILEDGLCAAWAWQQSLQETRQAYAATGDPYLRQRAADVTDVGNQVLNHLPGRPPAARLDLPRAVILVADQLTPTDTARLDPARILGVITAAGGPTDHSAILARALGIPAVSGADAALFDLPDGTRVALDGAAGHVWIEPAPALCRELETGRRNWLARRKNRARAGRRPAVTRDGRRVAVAANLGNAFEARTALENGAEGIGLLRTEFLYLTRSRPPSVDEQIAGLQAISRAMAGRPVCVRTLDVGGDKALAYLQTTPEANPYLGVRAIRLCLRRRELFAQQLSAVLQAAAEHPLKLMFPMVSTVEEVEQAREMLTAVHRRLVQENKAHGWPVPIGIMVETPAAALLAARLAVKVDFFSIGTNDLVQYTLAAERGHPDLAAYADALQPAVLKLIRQTVRAAHRYGKPVAVCGELAADPAAIPVLVGLGIDELSLAPAAIGAAKAVIRGLSYAQAVNLARRLIAADRAAAARKLATTFLAKHVRNGSADAK